MLALAVWAYYVVIGRVCAPMIQQRENAGGSLGQGGERGGRVRTEQQALGLIPSHDHSRTIDRLQRPVAHVHVDVSQGGQQGTFRIDRPGSNVSTLASWPPSSSSPTRASPRR